jgi:hypothetical protein
MAFDFTDPRLFGPRAALYALAFEEASNAVGLLTTEVVAWVVNSALAL